MKKKMKRLLGLFSKESKEKISTLFVEKVEMEKKIIKTKKELATLYKRGRAISERIKKISKKEKIKVEECPHPLVENHHGLTKKSVLLMLENCIDG